MWPFPPTYGTVTRVPHRAYVCLLIQLRCVNAAECAKIRRVGPTPPSVGRIRCSLRAGSVLPTGGPSGRCCARFANAMGRWTLNVRIELADVRRVPHVKRIADENRTHLGFLSKGELERAACRGRLVVATFGSSVVGFVNFWLRRDGVATIYAICVSVAQRRRGIGTGMLARVEEIARSAGMSGMKLKCPVEEEANDFYLRKGFILASVIEGKRRHLNVWEKRL